MDFLDTLKQLSERIERLKEQIQTEEATKNAFIMPFIQALGYDIFDPLEVVPEMVCDIGIKKGEKVDYCINKDGKPMILIECKHWKQNLSLHDNQLMRYFNVSNAKFGVLTNGIEWLFYSDLVAPNKMDEVPFLKINMLDLKEVHIQELKKFHKSYFDLDNILSSASELKYMGELKTRIAEEFKNPSAEFIKLLGKPIYSGVFSQKVLDSFTPLVKRAFSSLVNEIISDRLNTAIKNEEVTEASSQDDKENELPEGVVEIDEDKGIVTTEEELEAYRIVKAVVGSVIPPKRIYYRDAVSYFTIIVDDNNRKNICRLYLDSEKNKKMVIVEDNKEEVAYKLESIEDLYEYSEEIKQSASRYA